MTRRPWRLWGGFACLIATSLLTAYVPQIVGWAIETIELSETVNGESLIIDKHRLWNLIWLLVGLALAAGLFRFGMRKLLIDLSRLAERDFRDDLFRHLLKLSPSFYDRTMTGDIVTRLSSDIDAIRMVTGPGVMYLAQTAITVPVVLGLMLTIDVPLTLIAMIPLVIVPVLTRVLANEMYQRSRDVQDQMSTLSTMVQESLAGQRVIKSFNQEAPQQAKFDVINEEYVRRGLRFAWIFAATFPLLHAIFAIGLLVTVWIGGLRLLSGAVTAGELGAIFLWIFHLYWPLISLGWVLSLLQRGSASMARVQELLDEHSDVADRADAFTPPAFKGEIAFRALSFTYPGETQPALEKIDLTVPAGQTVGIVGATGSGKSTLAALVARFYPVPDGVLLIDGHDINRLRVSDLRQSIGFVAQETFLFSESIEDNIRFGQPEATRSEVEIASELAQLQEQVVSFPESYETMLGERGINLSGGQRQRAAIARATILDPAILILDDALSAVDTDTEERILEGLRGVMEGRTTLIIAHRISTVMSADEIIVLDRGRIVERGTHATLTAKGGLYADMHRRQLLEAQLEAVD
jgi:ATP-binding cassette subfamily B protein